MRVEEPDDLESPPSLEEHLRLVDLAIQAARSAHRLQGYEFDETYDANIVTDIKFSVADMHLPLGLIFKRTMAAVGIQRFYLREVQCRVEA